MSSFYGATYYWFAILIMAAIAISIWCWKCHKQGQARQEIILSRNPHLLQIQIEQEEARPSNYRPDAPPAYDDVINKPDEYPVYHEFSVTTTLPSSSEESNDSQPLPSYEDAVYFASHPQESFPSPHRHINDRNQLEQANIE